MLTSSLSSLKLNVEFHQEIEKHESKSEGNLELNSQRRKTKGHYSTRERSSSTKEQHAGRRAKGWNRNESRKIRLLGLFVFGDSLFDLDKTRIFL